MSGKKKKMGRPFTGGRKGKVFSFNCNDDHIKYIGDISKRMYLSKYINHLINLDRTYGKGFDENGVYIHPQDSQ